MRGLSRSRSPTAQAAIAGLDRARVSQAIMPELASLGAAYGHVPARDPSAALQADSIPRHENI